MSAAAVAAVSASSALPIPIAAVNPMAPAVRPSRMKEQHIEAYVGLLAAAYSEKIHASDTGGLLIELAQLAQQDPGFLSGDEKREWVMDVFNRLIGRVLFSANDLAKRMAILSSAESLLAAYKQFYKNPIEAAVVEPGGNLAGIKQQIIERHGAQLIEIIQKGVEAKNIAPLIIRIIAITAQIANLTEEEIAQIQMDLATDALGRAFPNREQDAEEMMSYLSMQAMIPSLIASLTAANRQVANLGKSIRAKCCPGCCMM